MDALVKILQKTDIFRDVPDKVLQTQILPHGLSQSYSKGQFVFTPQQKVDHFSIILSGRMQILRIFQDGGYTLMNILTEGDILASDLVCTITQLSPYHAAAANTCRIISFPITLLTHTGTIDETIRLRLLSNFLTHISNESIKKEYRLFILSQNGIRRRVMAYLTMRSAMLHQRTFTIPFSREEFAAYLRVNRSALSHELGLMQEEGLIAFHKNVFTLCAKHQ